MYFAQHIQSYIFYIQDHSMKILIKGADVVNEGRTERASVVIEDDVIADIIYDNDNEGNYDEVIDATGCCLLPGVIDDHVHFREPGMTEKADIESESRAAAYGGVTSYFDMPNTKPQTTTLKDLDNKFETGRKNSHVNYSFFIGATNDNIDELLKADIHRVPGVKLFMGSSTGNMLVDKEDALRKIFGKVKLPIMAHCEDTQVINDNMAEAKLKWGDDPDVAHHPEIRSEEACFRSTLLAVTLAKENGARLHVAHLTTARELELFENFDENKVLSEDGAKGFPKITAEGVIAHLMFTDADYSKAGAKIKCNPAVKSAEDRDALRSALTDGRIALVATDHAPHKLSEKQGGCCKAMSGMPMLQFSLVAMLSLVDEGVLTIERVVELMSHNPAKLFEVSKRGFIRKGYKADLVVVRKGNPWTVTKDIIQSKCGWSPLEGHTFRWKVEHTFCNGNHVYNNGRFDTESRGEEITFRKGRF